MKKTWLHRFSELLRSLAIAVPAFAVLPMLLSLSLLAQGQQCGIQAAQGNSIEGNSDYFIFALSQGACPKSVPELRQRLLALGFILEPTIVNRQGFGNVTMGQYAVVESVLGTPLGSTAPIPRGQFFITYNLEPNAKGVLDFEKNWTNQAVNIQVLVWDQRKNLFNFYELASGTQTPLWTYAGDSRNSIADTRLIYRVPGAPYGQSNRCTACHQSGGPILKEFTSPFNDWWQKARPLPFGNRVMDPQVLNIVKQVVDVRFAVQSVKSGIDTLTASPTYRGLRASTSMQELLRPVFCPTDVQLGSSNGPLDFNPALINVPSGFLVDPLFLKTEITLPTQAYLFALNAFGSKFGNTTRVDGDHAFITPVRSYNDQVEVYRLVQAGIISQETLADIYAVDMANPVFSFKRCRLLSLVPLAPSSNWLQGFIQVLASSNLPGAKEMALNFTSNDRTLQFHTQMAEQFITRCQQAAGTPQGAASLVKYLSQTRLAIQRTQISKHPNGSLLDQSKRFLFPKLSPLVNAQYFGLDANCLAVPIAPWLVY